MSKLLLYSPVRTKYCSTTSAEATPVEVQYLYCFTICTFDRYKSI